MGTQQFGLWDIARACYCNYKGWTWLRICMWFLKMIYEPMTTKSFQNVTNQVEVCFEMLTILVLMLFGDNVESNVCKERLSILRLSSCFMIIFYSVNVGKEKKSFILYYWRYRWYLNNNSELAKSRWILVSIFSHHALLRSLWMWIDIKKISNVIIRNLTN